MGLYQAFTAPPPAPAPTGTHRRHSSKDSTSSCARKVCRTRVSKYLQKRYPGAQGACCHAPGISDSRTHAPTLPGSCGGSITVDSVHGHSDPLDTVGSPPTHVIAVSYAIAAAYAAHSLETCGWNLRKVDWLNLEWVPACLQAKMLKPVGAYVLTAPEAPPPEVEQVEQSNPAGRLLLMGGGSSASSASYQKMIQKDGQTLSARLVGYENPADYDVGARADPGQHADQDPGWS